MAASGLVFANTPLRQSPQVKVVWRVTGTGPLMVRSIAPNGDERPLAFGPDPHGTSTFNQPGDEWGTGFAFDREGCWTVYLSRADGTAAAYFVVEAG